MFFSTFHYQTAPRFVSWGDLLSTRASALLHWHIAFFLNWFTSVNILFRNPAYVKLATAPSLGSRDQLPENYRKTLKLLGKKSRQSIEIRVRDQLHLFIITAYVTNSIASMTFTRLNLHCDCYQINLIVSLQKNLHEIFRMICKLYFIFSTWAGCFPWNSIGPACKAFPKEWKIIFGFVSIKL